MARPNQVCATDITDITCLAIAQSFANLNAVVDWLSGRAPAWRLSIKPEADLCI